MRVFLEVVAVKANLIKGDGITMKLMNLRLVAAGVVSVCLLAINVRVFAVQGGTDAGEAAATQGGLTEIVVTAQRRAEDIQKIPVAVTAIGAQELAERGITGLNDLVTGTIPTLRMEGFAGNQTILNIGIRGISTPHGQDITFENPVPLYIDDVYYGRASGLGVELNDLERIEVLRGPQGTLFGKNSLGGAIRLISKAPTGEFGGSGTLDAGNFGYWKAAVHVDLPAIGALAAKVDVLATGNHGWQVNPGSGQQNFGETQSQGAKLTLRYKPQSALLFEYAVDYTYLRSTEVFNQLLSSTDPYTLAAWPPEPDRINRLANGTYRPWDQQRYWGQRFNATWDISNSLTLHSISAYRNDMTFINNTASTSTALPGAFIGSTQPYLSGVDVTYDINHEQASEELQLLGTADTVQWVTGAFYMRERGDQGQSTYFGTTFPNAVLAGPAQGFFPISLGQGLALDPPLQLPGTPLGAKVTTQTEAVFGQATWRPNLLDNKLSFTGGVRVAHDTKEAQRIVGNIYANAFETVPSQVCPCAPKTLSQTHVPVTASVGYDWNATQHSYAKFSTGYQAGAFGVDSQTFKPVKASELHSYELGHKQELFDRRLRINTAVYYERWKDVQLSVQTISSSVSEYYNGPDVKGEGAELDVTFAPVESLSLTVGGAYTNLHTRAIPNPFPPPTGVGDPQGIIGKVQQAPRWTGSATLLYKFLRTGYGTWWTDLEATTTTPYYTVPVNITVPGYTLLNARLGLAELHLGGTTLELTAWGKNLANKSYLTYLYTAPGVLPGSSGTFSPFGAPRTFGVQLVGRF